MSKIILVTGALGLIGSVASKLFLDKGYKVIGVDNNMREFFFGEQSSVLKNSKNLVNEKNFSLLNIDIRDTPKLLDLFSQHSFEAIIHTAAQPSHDRAKDFPLLDFEINSLATLSLLELARKYQRDAHFIFTSTNKVYGDNPNKKKLKELETRYDFADKNFEGFAENCNVDHTTHSLFGSSKLAADIYVQEYGKYFGLKTTIFRLGCVTGESHASSQMHGFLHFLIKSAVHKKKYTIIGFGGKQVRDQIHALDVANAFWYVIQSSKSNGVVYNLGGGKDNAASILEITNTLKNDFNCKVTLDYIDKPRVGDHICYYSNTKKFQSDFPDWSITIPLDKIIANLVKHEKKVPNT